jgi:ADP-ribose pyrophosphatase
MVGEWQDEEVYRGSFLNVWVRTLAQPAGGTTRYEVVAHRDAVAIVALSRPAPGDATAEPHVALVRQLRPAIGEETIEIPAGLVRDHERDNPLQTAQRELREETGATGGRWRELTREYPSPGFSTECIRVYLAEDVEVAPNAGPKDSTEIHRVDWIPLSQALALCDDHTISDGKTLLGLTLVRGASTVSAQVSGGGDTMPLDPTNVPFQRAIRSRDPVDPVNPIDVSLQHAAAAAHGAGERGLDTSLTLEDMLIEEFNYASVTAYQALEDRARLFNNYLVIAAGGSVGVIGAIYQLNQVKAASLEGPVAAVLFLLLGILGIAFFTSLLRIRQAYGNSLLAMTTIKEFYIAQFEGVMPLARHAFLWRLDTLPRNERIGSVTFVKTFTVGLLGSLSLGGFAFFAADASLNHLLSGDSLTWASLGVGIGVTVVAALFLINFYRHATSNAKAIEAKRQDLAKLRSELAVSHKPS